MGVLAEPVHLSKAFDQGVDFVPCAGREFFAGTSSFDQVLLWRWALHNYLVLTCPGCSPPESAFRDVSASATFFFNVFEGMLFETWGICFGAPEKSSCLSARNRFELRKPPSSKVT